MKEKFSVRLMTELAVFAACGYVLDLVQGIYSDAFPFLANGGSIGIAMCAVFFVCFRHGLWGLLTALIIGLLDMLDGVYISPLANEWYKQMFQIFFDYFGAWLVVGLAGITAGLIKKKSSRTWVISFTVLSVFIGAFAKYLCHFASGFLFWPNEDVSSAVLYSLTYNLTYMGPSFVLCAVVMTLLVILQPKFTLNLKEEDTIS